jgi:prepilin-type N-terminal cleavage/methylation domain-containing protein
MILTRLKKKNTNRHGFTLIELLVVVLIISILASLIGAAVVKAMGTGKQVRNRADISQLENALEAFKSRFGVYPPSRIKLSETWNYNISTPGIDADSVQILTRIFPRINTSSPVDWNGNGVIQTPQQGGDYILEGDQCLVFFLGGIPGSSVPLQCLGFSTNPTNPAYSPPPGSPDDRIGPFLDFASNRLVLLQPPPPQANQLSRSPLHYSYLDTYGISDGQGKLLTGLPYAYFSSNNRTNGYNRYSSSDCPMLGVWPYAEIQAPLKYWKANSFQIVAAGGDGVFGVGGVLQANGLPATTWTPATASTIYPQNDPNFGKRPNPGYDDQSNFTGSLLGVGQD